MGHYYECLVCGEERCRCRCGPPSRGHDPAFTQIVQTWPIDKEWSLLRARHTHYDDAHQMQLLVNGKRCPVDVIIKVLNDLTNSNFPAGIATVRGPLYRQMLEPSAARQVVVMVVERLGLSIGEVRRTNLRELGDFTFVGHRHGPWRDKAIALRNQLRATLILY